MTRRRLRQKSASASGDTGHVDTREASDKVGKSALASGDEHAVVLRRPAASPTSNSLASASGDRVVTSIYSHGVRIRCLVERRQELTDAVRARRSSRSVWDPSDWRREIHALKAKMAGVVVCGWGGSRSKPLAIGKTGLDTATGKRRKRKSADRDSADVLASGSKDRSNEQLASGNKDRGIEYVE